MRSDVVVENLHTCEDRCIGLLERAHDTFTVTDLSIQPFHLVGIVISRERNLSNVNGAIHVLVSPNNRSQNRSPCSCISEQFGHTQASQRAAYRSRLEHQLLECHGRPCEQTQR